nr:nucleotidyltransferase family protein [Thermotogota bacterium]
IFPEAYKSEDLNFDFEPLWESRRVLDYNGYRINVQGFEENIVFLIYHGSKHGYFRLKWLFDLYVLLSMPEINWESLIKRTEAINIRHMLVQTVLLVDDYFNTSLQIELKKHLTIIHSEIRLKEMAKALALDGDEDQTKLGHRHFFLFKRYKILQIKGFRYKLNYILFVFRPKKIDFQDWQLSDRFYGLYYLYRPFHRIYRLFKEK